MPVRLRSVAFPCDDPSAAAEFWASVLSRQVVEDAYGLLVPGDDTQLGLRFGSGVGRRTGPDRIHLHLTSSSPDHQVATVARARDLGARHLDVGQRPEEGHVVLADRGGNAFCVIEPGNAFLAGCGFLGEIACDGSREVGVFWSAALDWPLVWDQDEETAVQSPRGGTKVAWGGLSERADPADPPRFELVVVDAEPSAEVERLTALGATADHRAGDGAVLTDPDGVAFRLVTEQP